MPIKRREKPVPEIPLASTADVAFLLLIFFIVAASNVSLQGRDLDVPSTTESEEEATEQVELVITEQTISLNGEPLGRRDLVALNEALAGKPNRNDRVVIVEAEDGVPWQQYNDVIAAVERVNGIPALQIESEDGGAP